MQKVVKCPSICLSVSKTISTNLLFKNSPSHRHCSLVVWEPFWLLLSHGSFTLGSFIWFKRLLEVKSHSCQSWPLDISGQLTSTGTMLRPLKTWLPPWTYENMTITITAVTAFYFWLLVLHCYTQKLLSKLASIKYSVWNTLFCYFVRCQCFLSVSKCCYTCFYTWKRVSVGLPCPGFQLEIPLALTANLRLHQGWANILARSILIAECWGKYKNPSIHLRPLIHYRVAGAAVFMTASKITLHRTIPL